MAKRRGGPQPPAQKQQQPTAQKHPLELWGGGSGIAALVTAVVTALAIGYAIYKHTTPPTTVPSTPTLPLLFADAAAPPPGPPAACVVAAISEFHLRPHIEMQSEGTQYPMGTALELLERGTLQRGDSTLYRVRVTRTREEGWTFVGPRELATCPAR